MKVNLEVIFEDSDFPTKEQFKEIANQIRSDMEKGNNVETDIWNEFERRFFGENEFQEHFNEDVLSCMDGYIDFDKITEAKYKKDFLKWLTEKLEDEICRRFNEIL